MVVAGKVNLKELYEVDDSLWLEKTVELLREKKYDQLDLDNLIEELDDLGRERKNKVESLLRQVIIHLLLLQYWRSQYEWNAYHWEAEITEFRTQLKISLTTNLRNYLNQKLDQIYQDALKYSQRKTRLDNLPQQCPYSLEQLLDQDWFPEIE